MCNKKHKKNDIDQMRETTVGEANRAFKKLLSDFDKFNKMLDVNSANYYGRKNMDEKERAEQVKKTLEEKKLRKVARIQNFDKFKKTHDWYSWWNDKGAGTGSWQLEHCKKCGIHYTLFKARPEECKC